MPKLSHIKKVLVIGSGPIVIGQGAEFDYSGAQACQVLKSEGIEVVLLNNNPATIMTDKVMADRVYMEPMTLETVKAIFEREKPDALLAGMGGQTALNLAMALDSAGLLQAYGVEVIGTSPASIVQAESREAFKQLMNAINEPSVPSEIATSLEEAYEAAIAIGYPVVIRPAFTLGGTGGGIAQNEAELATIVSQGLGYAVNGQVLIEKCISGWKEVEFEMMRDAAGTAIAVCSMENIDPVGIHTGDSMVVAPTQTLSDREVQMLRTASINIVNALDIRGGCNVQFALNPSGLTYSVIEVNPRVSRSSALASKATGYPIAKVAAQIALGYRLDEILNDVTGATTACFEPALDYCVVKVPKFAFDKFKNANRKLGTMMMATGEAMAIACNFEAALLKALRSLETGLHTLCHPAVQALTLDELFEALSKGDDQRLFVISELIRREVSVASIAKLTGITAYFLDKVAHIVQLEKTISSKDFRTIGAERLLQLKQYGFSDQGIASLCLFATPELVRETCLDFNIRPAYQMVDTCGGEFEASSAYFYGVYGRTNETIVSHKKKILVLGSGPIRIGQGIEFDYCTVRGIKAIQAAGYEAIVINNNPETVSTDFSTSDRLYFEPLTLEDVLNVIDLEKPEAVLLQFGGQTGLKLAGALARAGIKLLGSSWETLHTAEDREAFGDFTKTHQLPTPVGKAVRSVEQGLTAAKAIGMPLLVRPSYVLGGLGMRLVKDELTLDAYLKQAFELDGVETVLLDRYMAGIECEVDAICDGQQVLIPAIMEHLEGAGVHSGDSMAVYPPTQLTESQKQEIAELTKTVALKLGVIGLVNVQFVISNQQVYLIEVNPRSSRTVPFISKVTGVPLSDLAVAVMLGQSLVALGYEAGLMAESDRFYVKMPVFSGAKLLGVDPKLGPEMQSTGELLSSGQTLQQALLKGFHAVGFKGISKGKWLIDCSEQLADNVAELMVSKASEAIQWILPSQSALGLALGQMPNGPLKNRATIVNSDQAEAMIRSGEVTVVISLYETEHIASVREFQLRRAAVEHRGILISHMDTFESLLTIAHEHELALEIYNLV